MIYGNLDCWPLCSYWGVLCKYILHGFKFKKAVLTLKLAMHENFNQSPKASITGKLLHIQISVQLPSMKKSNSTPNDSSLVHQPCPTFTAKLLRYKIFCILVSKISLIYIAA